MTPRARFQRLSRAIFAFQIVPMLPGMGALLVCLVRSPASLVSWCEAYWWLLLSVGVVIGVVGISWLSFLYRCPMCKFRFSRAAVPLYMFPSGSVHIRFCPHCGHSLDAAPTEPTR